MQVDHPVIFYDGFCKLCNRAVKFVIKHDRSNRYRFAPLQSEVAANALRGICIHKQNPDSIVYLENEKIYQRSDAVLHVLKNLDGGWKLLYVFMIIPPFIRDSLYDIVARNRFRWFGRNENCSVVPREKSL